MESECNDRFAVTEARMSDAYATLTPFHLADKLDRWVLDGSAANKHRSPSS